MLQTSEIIVPPYLVRQRIDLVAAWRVHQLLIDLVLRSCASGGFGQHLAAGALRRLKIFAEGVEEVVVSRLAGVLPIAHGEAIDHFGVKRGIGESIRHGPQWRLARAGAQIDSPGIDAIAGAGCPVDEGLGINAAGQMIVQVGALRHIAQKNQQEIGIVADALEIPLGAGFIGARLRIRRSNQGSEANEKGTKQ